MSSASTAPTAPTPPSAAPPRRWRRIGLLALLLALALVATGMLLRGAHEHTLARRVEFDATPTVSLLTPSHDAATRKLILPGSVQAFYDAPIHARVSGYLKAWYVDIGTKVHAGDVLAEIETPELEQQLQQAQADLATAQAHAALAESTSKRWQAMLVSTSVSKQEADEKNGDAQARKAEVTSARANVDRLHALTGFRRVVAPFDGTVTARKTDIGALINAGAGAGPELFRVADVHKLRIYVDVPQAYVGDITPGMTAQLRLPERPGRSYTAILVGSAGAIDPTSRTMQVQLQTDNADGELIAGAYAEVQFALPASAEALQLPVTALQFRHEGLQVATLDRNDRVALKSIELGRDFGTRVEVTRGLDGSDRVIDSPPDWLVAGDRVHVAAAPVAATASDRTGSTE